MSSTDYDTYPGSLTKNKLSYHSPKIIYFAKNKKTKRQWQFFIQVFPDLKCSKSPIKLGSKAFTDRLWSPVKDGAKFPAKYWAESGMVGGKITHFTPSYAYRKNIGKANESNPFMTALVILRQKFILKLRGLLGDENLISTKDFKNSEIHLPDVDKIVEYYINNKDRTEDTLNLQAMKIRDISQHQANPEKYSIDFPALIQIKYDGLFGCIFLSKKTGDYTSVQIYLRGGTVPLEGFNHIKKEILPYLRKMWNNKKNISLRVVGELYTEGKTLQQITSIVRTKLSNRENDSCIKLFIFDGFYMHRPNDNNLYRWRNYCLPIFSDKNNFTSLILVKYKIVDNSKNLRAFFKQSVLDKREGIIVRNLDAKYIISLSKNESIIRSDRIYKWKPYQKDVYKIVSFTEQSKGKRGLIIFQVETEDGVIASVTPNETEKTRRAWMKLAKINKRHFTGKLYEVKYRQKSPDGSLMEPKGLGFIKSN